MKPAEIRGLAKATCAWLAYKHITGFNDTLGEAILALPISEYLKTQTTWLLQSETLYEDVGLPKSPQFSCDFAGGRRHGEKPRFLLETKYLKSVAYIRSRDIAADLIRLSLPPDEHELRRYFLLAGDAAHFKAGEDAFLSECRLFDLAQGHGKYFKPRDEVQRPNFRQKFPQFDALLSFEQRYLAAYAYLQCGANEQIQVDDERHFRVMIWSIGRSERSAESGLSDAE